MVDTHTSVTSWLERIYIKGIELHWIYNITDIIKSV